jgi:uncharacterized integral membrane protein
MTTPRPDAVTRVQALQDDPRFDRLRSVASRRLLVGLVAALVAAVTLVAWQDEVFLLLPLLLVTAAAGALLRRSVRLVADAPDEALDERLVAVRDRAYRTAYSIHVSVTMLALLLVFMAMDAARVDFALEARHLHALFWLVTCGGILLPSAVVALRDREPVE